MPQTPSSPIPKPISEVWRPDLVRLPALTIPRRIFRRFMRGVCRALMSLFTRTTVTGLEKYPREGAALIVINHLGDPDGVVLLAFLPEFPECIGKIELRSDWRLKALLEGMGVIWIHRGRADRRALTAALEGLRQGRRVLISPEGRESPTGALEKGTDGAAFLAVKAGVPIVPITLTGTEHKRVENAIRTRKKTAVTLTVGEPFRVQAGEGHGAKRLEPVTRQIMESLASQLPREYRGVYGKESDEGK